MPVGPGRYRVMTTKSGKKVRLHFTPGGRVNEAKNMQSGKVHTPSEFGEDRRAKKTMKRILAEHVQAGRLKKRRAVKTPPRSKLALD